jgi:outer membrane receptor for Fe3+-dicitrate
VNNYNCGTLSGRETVSAVYATATLKTGNLEVIPGLRFEHTDPQHLLGHGLFGRSGTARRL